MNRCRIVGVHKAGRCEHLTGLTAALRSKSWVHGLKCLERHSKVESEGRETKRVKRWMCVAVLAPSTCFGFESARERMERDIVRRLPGSKRTR